MDVNRTLIADHGRRAASHTALVASLKTLNSYIQRFSNLRRESPAPMHVLHFLLSFTTSNPDISLSLSVNGTVGRQRAGVVSACREAIRSGEMDKLFSILKFGAVPPSP
jgi:hypothetical protein